MFKAANSCDLFSNRFRGSSWLRVWPRTLVAADLPFARKDEAKAAGFRWVPEARQWQRRCTAAQIEALPFPVIPLEEAP